MGTEPESSGFELFAGGEVICTNDVAAGSVINCSGLRNDGQSVGMMCYVGMRMWLMQSIDIYHLATDRPTVESDAHAQLPRYR